MVQLALERHWGPLQTKRQWDPALSVVVEVGKLKNEEDCNSSPTEKDR